MSVLYVRGVAFHHDGLTIEYASQQDLRGNGLMKNHVLFVPAIDQYAELLDDLIDAVQIALKRGLEDFEFEPPPADETDDETETNPYDNPTERDGVLS